MLHAENQDRISLIKPSDEQQNLVGSLAFNVQDRHWLVYCALGYSRSASTVAAWLLYSGRCKDVQQALAHLRRARPQVVLSDAHQHALQGMLELSNSTMPAGAAAHGY